MTETRTKVDQLKTTVALRYFIVRVQLRNLKAKWTR